MKTKFSFLRLGVIFFFLLNFTFWGCNENESIIPDESDLTSSVNLKSASLTPDGTVCDLLAGQTINVGKVIYSHDADNLYVTYLVNSPWILTEVHFYAGTFDGLPRNKNAIQVGHFPYDTSDLQGNQLIIPLSGLSSDDGILTLAAHAVVINEDKNETAWAECTLTDPVVAAKVRFNDWSYALTDGTISYADYFNNTSTHWCSSLGINSYAISSSDLQSRWYPLGGAGTVEVSDNGDNFKVKITATVAGKTMTNSYLFVGPLDQLGNIAISTDGCPDYTQFPFVKNETNNVHEYVIPFPISSKSFKDAFGTNRWGWVSFYQL